MAGLVPAIHALLFSKAWIPGTRPGMTKERLKSWEVKTVASRSEPHH
jgi:hypothetical protein